MTIQERYEEKFKGSLELHRRALETIPTGTTQSRVPRPFPIYMERAQGPLKWDVDGNELVDYVMGSGALLLGHEHPKVTEAVRQRVGLGVHILANPLVVRWAELVKSLMPSVERVRFTGSGTECTYLALRLARAFTGKTKIVKLREHFHGWHDYVTPSSGLNTTAGIPKETLSTVVLVDPDVAAVRRALEADDDIAAVIAEPTGAHWGHYPLQSSQFLHDLREVTAKHGVMMIMDEVITGFRLSRGGAQQRYDVRPDLTTMSKVMGGGFACGAVGGRADILALVEDENEDRRVGNTGTFNGNTLASTAGIACLEVVANEPVNERAEATANRLKAGLTDALMKMEVTGHVHGVASLVHIVLGAECDCGGGACTMPHSQIDQAMTPERTDMLRMAMLNEGVDLMSGEGFMVSAVHGEEDVDSTVEAFEHALAALREERVVS